MDLSQQERKCVTFILFCPQFFLDFSELSCLLSVLLLFLFYLSHNMALCWFLSNFLIFWFFTPSFAIIQYDYVNWRRCNWIVYFRFWNLYNIVMNIFELTFLKHLVSRALGERSWWYNFLISIGSKFILI